MQSSLVFRSANELTDDSSRLASLLAIRLPVLSNEILLKVKQTGRRPVRDVTYSKSVMAVYHSIVTFLQLHGTGDKS